ncbi:hypothetical protein GGS23DRAFT_615632 [Durotheca rogersii]|uniref:uncharacterized protein n=1 Tax=Durotheca rogersii TaxID=419775 RepID=UPI0022204B95|nr:uncharacterized protein GGS23DRAFT_615632 [Durotheca rogersii]KAI5866985.1 hypothetical protein GGS23DRAFT_615632 [Durotheca rogersii]
MLFPVVALAFLPLAICSPFEQYPYYFTKGDKTFNLNADFDKNGVVCIPGGDPCTPSYTYQLDLNHCFTNDGGRIIGRKDGWFAASCSDCGQSHVPNQFTCDCGDGKGGSKTSSGWYYTSGDLKSPLEYTEPGRFSCYGHQAERVGVQSN